MVERLLCMVPCISTKYYLLLNGNLIFKVHKGVDFVVTRPPKIQLEIKDFSVQMHLSSQRIFSERTWFISV